MGEAVCRMLTNNLDAGYELAEKTAREKGVNIPMIAKRGNHYDEHCVD